LSDFNRDLFEHAVHARAHAQLIDLRLAKSIHGAQLIDARLLRLQLRLEVLLGDLHAILFDLVPRCQRFGAHRRLLERELRHQSVFGEIFIDLFVQLRSLELGADRGGDRSLCEPIGHQPRLQAVEVCLGRAQLLLRLTELLLELGIAELEDDGVGRHDRTRANHDALDPALRRRRNPAPRFVHRKQRSEAAHLSQHRSAFHRIHPHRCLFNRGRRGLETRQNDRDEADHEHAGNRERYAAELLLPRDRRGSLNVHS
jgi:hypothetical protein